jgi:acyl-CoA thioesterase FadM
LMLNLVHRRFGGFPLTGRLEMRYKTRIKIGQTIVAEARISSTTRKTVWAECEMRSGGHVCTTGRAMFIIRTSDVAD